MGVTVSKTMECVAEWAEMNRKHREYGTESTGAIVFSHFVHVIFWNLKTENLRKLKWMSYLWKIVRDRSKVTSQLTRASSVSEDCIQWAYEGKDNKNERKCRLQIQIWKNKLKFLKKTWMMSILVIEILNAFFRSLIAEEKRRSLAKVCQEICNLQS